MNLRTRHASRPSRRTGFTLLELMLASAILAVVSALGMRAFVAAMNLTEKSEEVLAHIAELERAWFRLEDDLLALRLRPVRNDFGSTEAALRCDAFGEFTLALTRGGRQPIRIADEPARSSSLERVGYQLRDNKLYRISRARLEGDTEPRTRLLLDQVQTFRCRVADANARWRDSWPPAADGTQTEPPRPVAVEITLETQRDGELTRLFYLLARPMQTASPT